MSHHLEDRKIGWFHTSTAIAVHGFNGSFVPHALNHSRNAAKSVRKSCRCLVQREVEHVKGGIWRRSPCFEHVSLTKFTQNVGFLSHRKHSFVQHTGHSYTKMVKQSVTKLI